MGVSIWRVSTDERQCPRACGSNVEEVGPSYYSCGCGLHFRLEQRLQLEHLAQTLTLSCQRLDDIPELEDERELLKVFQRVHLSEAVLPQRSRSSEKSDPGPDRKALLKPSNSPRARANTVSGIPTERSAVLVWYCCKGSVQRCQKSTLPLLLYSTMCQLPLQKGW
jgi:hypothetical protein